MAALGPFEHQPRLAVAVSGGPDSMALTLLAARWAGQGGGSVLALTVDHGLRPESAAEVGQVARWLSARGIATRVLIWGGPRPATAIQAAARIARYELLTAACHEAGILHLLLAHHADDLAETAFIRAERHSGSLGLAAMAAIREGVGLRLLRPLLAVPRVRLAATLRALDQPWLDDPSNSTTRFRRGRLRRDPTFDRRAWFDLAVQAGRARAELDEELAAFAVRAVTPDPLGFLTISLPCWRKLTDDGAGHILERCIGAVAGGSYPPASASIAALVQRVIAGPVRLTLGGARLVTRGQHLLVVREAGRIRDRHTLAPGDTVLWDGRFEVRYRAGPPEVTLRPLLAAGRLQLPVPLREALRARRVPAAAIEALPGLWCGERVLASPLHAAEQRGTPADAGFLPKPAACVAPARFAALNVV